jgi:hypothetical protein
VTDQRDQGIPDQPHEGAAFDAEKGVLVEARITQAAAIPDDGPHHAG